LVHDITANISFSDTLIQKYAREKLGLSKTVMVTPKATLAPVGNPEFNRYLINRLHNPYLVAPRAPQDSRGCDRDRRVPSVYSQRAKAGYRYWPQDESSKVTSLGKLEYNS